MPTTTKRIATADLTTAERRQREEARRRKTMSYFALQNRALDRMIADAIARDTR